MKYIPPYILEKIRQREERKREELYQRPQLPVPLPPMPEIEEKKEKEDCIIIDMGGEKNKKCTQSTA